jgi:hypothetical protein
MADFSPQVIPGGDLVMVYKDKIKGFKPRWAPGFQRDRANNQLDNHPLLFLSLGLSQNWP